MRLLFLLIIIFFASCSNDNVAGSTSVGNGFVEASLTFDGNPVSTNVMLVPSDYMPVVDSPIDIMKSTSSIEGIVKFDSLFDSSYSLVVIDTINQFGIVSSGILPTFNSDSTIDIALGRLGTFAYYLPDSLSAKVVTIYIKGTPVNFETTSFTKFENGMKQVLFNNMPMGDELISTITIDDSAIVTLDTISIIEDDTISLSFNDINIDNIRPLWEFPLIVGVTSDMVSTYGTLDSVKTLIKDHLSRAEVAFHNEKIYGYISFPIDSIYVYTGTLNDENILPPEDFAYRLLYSPNEKSPFGGLNTDNRVYVQDHGEMESGGTFGEMSLIGLRWLLGTARGAYYLLWEEVNAAKNEISGTAYTASESIMSLKSSDKWHSYNVNLINHSNSRWYDSVYTTKFLSSDTIQIKLIDTTGQPLENATVEFYGVIGYNSQVDTNVVQSDTSSSDGIIYVQAPYLSVDKKSFVYTNTLIKIVYNGITTYEWLPYSEVSYNYIQTNSYVFYKEITFEP